MENYDEDHTVYKSNPGYEEIKFYTLGTLNQNRAYEKTILK